MSEVPDIGHIPNTMTDEQIIEEMPGDFKQPTADGFALAKKLVEKSDSIGLYHLYQESVRKQLDLIRTLDTIIQHFGPTATPSLINGGKVQRQTSDIATIKAMADQVVELAKMIIEKERK